MPPTLAELITASSGLSDCSIVEPARASVGGVDPLGLRQINFDLMNQVFPGLNNVARHVRPFTLVTWAWRRTISLARERNIELSVSAHEDFVARIEVAFVWSLLQTYDAGDLDLPGKQRITAIWGEAKRLDFGNDAWRDFVKARRHSTALTAAINYGPGLRAFRMLDSDSTYPGVRVPHPSMKPALDAFEKRLRPILKHPLFNSWDPCSLKRSTAEQWADVWDIDDLLDEEREAVRDRMLGSNSSAERRGGFTLLSEAIKISDDPEDEGKLRSEMYECSLESVRQPSLLWQRIQSRQAFRLALEALFEWIISEIDGGTLTTADLASRFVGRCGDQIDADAEGWLSSMMPDGVSPVDAMTALQLSFVTGQGIERAIAVSLAVTVLAAPELYDQSGRSERLPVKAAYRDFDLIRQGTTEALVGQIIEHWVIAQHTYWSVGRGLADARAGAKRIMRLRIVLEPNGWRVTRGRGSRSMPNPTPDRLRTAISLAEECGLT